MGDFAYNETLQRILQKTNAQASLFFNICRKATIMKKNRKGFTLAELLIVVAIIGILAAISIPIFTKQLEKARDAATLANLRNVYAEVQTEYMGLDNPSGGTPKDNYWVNGGRHIFVTYQNGESVIIDAFVQIKSKKTMPQMQKFIKESNLAYKDVLSVYSAVKPGIYELDFTYSPEGTLSSVALKEVSSTFYKYYGDVSAS
jgi:prepilin-type N-terminal cleavage/methylation domain-containing protein